MVLPIKCYDIPICFEFGFLSVDIEAFAIILPTKSQNSAYQHSFLLAMLISTIICLCALAFDALDACNADTINMQVIYSNASSTDLLEYSSQFGAENSTIDCLKKDSLAIKQMAIRFMCLFQHGN